MLNTLPPRRGRTSSIVVLSLLVALLGGWLGGCSALAPKLETPQLSLLGELRWFGTDNRRASGPNDTRFDVEYNTVDVLVGASYNF